MNMNYRCVLNSSVSCNPNWNSVQVFTCGLNMAAGIELQLQYLRGSVVKRFLFGARWSVIRQCQWWIWYTHTHTDRHGHKHTDGQTQTYEQTHGWTSRWTEARRADKFRPAYKETSRLSPIKALFIFHHFFFNILPITRMPIFSFSAMYICEAKNDGIIQIHV